MRSSSRITRRIARSRICNAVLETVEPRRLMAATLDPSFGNAGVAKYDDGSNQFGTANTVELPGGKVLSVSNYIFTYGTLALRRFTSTGAPDATFGTNGAITLDLGTGPDNVLAVTSVAAASDGSIYIAGEFSDPNLAAQDGFVGHILANGSLDSGYGNGVVPGLSFFQFGGEAVNHPHLAIGTGGNVFVGYTITQNAISNAAVLDLDAAGNPVQSYSNGGTAVFTIPGAEGDLGKILVRGTSLLLVGDTYKTIITGPNGEPNYAFADSSVFLATLDASGTLVTGADNGSDGQADGFELTVVSNSSQFKTDGAAYTPVGGLVVGGNVTTFGNSGATAHHPTFVSFDAVLALNAGFGSGGIATLNTSRDIRLNDLDTFNESVGVDAAGNVYGVGTEYVDPSNAQLDLAVVRLTSTGTLDTSFDGDGIYTFNSTDGDTGTAITSDGAFVTGLTQSLDASVVPGAVVLKLAPAVVTPPPPPPPTNTAPTVSPVTSSPAAAAKGQSVTLSSTFTDPDAADTFQVSWNYGDGVTTPYASTTNKSVSTTHAYTAAGTYTVTLSVKDSAGNVSSNTGTVKVGNYSIVANKLTYSGSASNDSISVTKNSSGQLVVTDGSASYTITSTVTSIVLDGGAGDDLLKISTAITLPTTLIGGDGNDTLRGGSGSDVELGDAGNDSLIGRDGRDILVGGVGADLLIGNEQDDLLISGTTTYGSTNFAAYSAIQSEWTSSHSWIVRVANLSGLIPLPGRLNGNFYLTPFLNVFDDTSVDTLVGGAGDDIPFATLFGAHADKIVDNQTIFSSTIMTLINSD